MSVEHNVYIGRYIKQKSRTYNKLYSETIYICSNDVDCKNHFSNKNLLQMKFCPDCGSKVVPENVILTKQVPFDVEDICDELFGDGGKFYINEDGYILYNGSSVFAEHLDDGDEFDLSKMFEYMKNKNVPDDVDILSSYLTKLGVENEIKFGAVGYYS